jgi:hypothetical protein
LNRGFLGRDVKARARGGHAGIHSEFEQRFLQIGKLPRARAGTTIKSSTSVYAGARAGQGSGMLAEAVEFA